MINNKEGYEKDYFLLHDAIKKIELKLSIKMDD